MKVARVALVMAVVALVSVLPQQTMGKRATARSAAPPASQQMVTCRPPQGLLAPPGSAANCPASGLQPAPATLGAPASNAPAADAAGGTFQLHQDAALETARGSSIAASAGARGEVLVNEFGTVTLVDPSGATAWERSPASLYRDWHLSWTTPTDYPVTPEIVAGTDVADPFVDATDDALTVRDATPVAVGDLLGDGSQEIAVAEEVGENLTGDSPCICQYPFDVSGSSLHLGTFLTILDASTGATLYDEVLPGFVTQLSVIGGMLLVGDETGSPQSQINAIGQWYSTTTLEGLTFTRAGASLQAHHQWSFDTHAPWARLLGLQSLGGDAVALAWTDTPLGLGLPGPPLGHVVALDARTGSTLWHQDTPDYPVLLALDPSRGELVVAEEADTSQSVGYLLVGLRLQSGATAVTLQETGVLPTALQVVPGGAGAAVRWVTAGVETSLSLLDPPYYSYTGSRVAAFDPAAGSTALWTTELPEQPSAALAPFPGTVLVTGSGGQAEVVVGSWLLTATDPTDPVAQHTEVRALSAQNGATRWAQSGDAADPLSLALLPSSGGHAAVVSGVTEDQTANSWDASTGAAVATIPLLGDFYAGTSATVPGVGSVVLLGGASGGVFAFAASSLATTPKLLWVADVGGAVTQIQVADLGGGAGPQAIVSATTSTAVIDLRTGHVRYRLPSPGYVWTAAISGAGTTGCGAVIVVPTDALRAYRGCDGAPLWTYQPSGASTFSDVAISQGTVLAERTSAPGQAPSIDAVALSAATGAVRWDVAEDPSTTRQADLQSGVAAGAAIPGAGGQGVAFSFVGQNAGRVEVRDVKTGALDYEVSETDMEDQVALLVDPSLGLLEVNSQGTVDVRPGGASVVRTGANAQQATILHLGGGRTVLLLADAGVDVYPGSAPTQSGSYPSPIATNNTFFTGQTVVVQAGGRSEVLGLPQDQTERNILEAEQGGVVLPDPFFEPFEYGIVAMNPEGSPSSTGAPAPAAPPSPAAAASAPPAAEPVASPSGKGVAEAQPDAWVATHGALGAGVPRLTSASPSGYTPSVLRAYLGLKGDGSGQTVAIVDAYADPSVVSDLATFSAQFGLPLPCGTPGAAKDCASVTVDQPGGAPVADTELEQDWALETSLDVDSVHTVAPQASIVVEQAHDQTAASLFAAVDAAAALNPAAISMSWGFGDEFSEEGYYDHHCELSRSLCIVATGDAGYPGGYPAYTPGAVSVGGTTLQLTSSGQVTSEVSWDESGGGRSYFEAAASPQKRVTGIGSREIPDVSYDADPQTGVAVYDSVPYQGQTGWFQVGGTSLGAPSWAGILASADQLRAKAGKPPLVEAGGSAASTLYGDASALRDITGGPDNGQCPGQCQAASGYDEVTGLGSPLPGLDAALAGGASTPATPSTPAPSPSTTATPASSARTSRASG